jgi:hypothetical protein
MKYVVLLISIFMFTAFYIRATYYIKAYYLLTGRKFTGYLIPYGSINSWREQLILIPFLPFLFAGNERNHIATKYIRLGGYWNFISLIALVSILALAFWGRKI